MERGVDLFEGGALLLWLLLSGAGLLVGILVVVVTVGKGKSVFVIIGCGIVCDLNVIGGIDAI